MIFAAPAQPGRYTVRLLLDGDDVLGRYVRALHCTVHCSCVPNRVYCTVYRPMYCTALDCVLYYLVYYVLHCVLYYVVYCVLHCTGPCTVPAHCAKFCAFHRALRQFCVNGGHPIFESFCAFHRALLSVLCHRLFSSRLFFRFSICLSLFVALHFFEYDS